MKQFGLIGYPLTHSFSKKYFEEKFLREKIEGCAYDLFPIESINLLPNLIASHPHLIGLNVTIPYKETVMPYLQSVDTLAAEIGAVNCIKVTGQTLAGYNTDAYGFEQSLLSFLTHTPDKAFVLGTGGSSRAVCYVLKKLQIPFLLVTRNPQQGGIGYDSMETHLNARNLVINTTPVGMYPNAENSPHLPYKKLTKHDFLFDLIYNPSETFFMLKGKEQGCAVKNGLEMLQLQAEKSWEIWQG